VKSRDGAIHGALVPIKADSLRDLVADYGRAINVDAPRGMKFTRDVELIPEKEDKIAVKRNEAEISRQLFQQLIAPVTSFLPANPQDVVVIVPHQSLWQLPFAALRDADNRFFGEAHVLTYAASESSWRLGARRKRQADHRNIRAWIAGNPKMPASLLACGNTVTVSSLPGAEQEAKEIARLLGKNSTELFIGNQADRLRLEAWHADFSVLHFATHGFACSNDPLSSFIVLTALNAGQLRLDKNAETISSAADARFPVTLDSLQEFLANPETAGMAELFYPGELEARTIITRFHLKADLVTLSACQTGLGQLSNEGNIGLSRAFLAAGARSFVVSLWSVDDEATKDFMLAFYQEYLRHGNKGLALQNAMQRTRQRYPEPKYWAAFTLMGMAE
jgi:CHAT domain-containing protein